MGTSRPTNRLRARRRVRPRARGDDAVARLRAGRAGRVAALQRRLRAGDGLLARRGGRPPARRRRDPSGGGRGVPRGARVHLEDGALEPAGRPLADEDRRPPADRLVEQARARDSRLARVPRHRRHSTSPTARRPRTSPRSPVTPRRSSSRSASWRRSSERCAAWRRSSRRRQARRACSWRSRRSARACSSVSASSVWRYEGDDTATVVGRYNRDGIDSFPLGARLSVDENHLDRTRPRDGAPGAGRGLGHGGGRARRADAAARLPLDGRRADHRRGQRSGAP